VTIQQFQGRNPEILQHFVPHIYVCYVHSLSKELFSAYSVAQVRIYLAL